MGKWHVEQCGAQAAGALEQVSFLGYAVRVRWGHEAEARTCCAGFISMVLNYKVWR